MRFSILGPFEVTSGQLVLTPTAPKLRQVLAQLVLQCNQIAHIDRLIDDLWDDEPPASARTTLQTYIYQLRKLLARAGRGKEDLLLTKPSGYLAAIQPEAVDAHLFDQYLSRGHAALERSDPHTASRELRQALGLWRGEALVDVVTGSVLGAQAIRLAENRLRALEMRVKADLSLGRHRELVSELKELVAAHPLHEGLYSQLMLALYRSGRRFEAMEVYQQLRRSLVDELGLEPSSALMRMHQSILAGDPALDPAPPAESINLSRPAGAEVHGRAPELVSAHLPAEPAEFVGRADELEQIYATFDLPDSPGPQIVAIEGVAGAGKTALAARAAHLLRARFPDGQLFVPLSGGGTEPLDVADALARMLLAAGVPAAQVPEDVAGRSAMFCGWSAERRVLVVIDDAASAAQVAPLLPIGREAGALVTSRPSLPELARTHTVPLGPLPEDAAVDLLASIIEPVRAAADPAAARTVVEQCGRLPSAIRTAGARLNSVPHWPLGRFATQLAGEDHRPDGAPAGGPDLGHDHDLGLGHDLGHDLAETLDQAYRRLDAAAQRALRLLSLMPRDGNGPAGAATPAGPGRDEAATGQLQHPEKPAA